MKKLVVLALSLTLTAMLGIGATMAWFTDSKEVTNVVTMGDVKITLTEDKYTGDSSNASIVPGDIIDKDPTIDNVGQNDALIRVKLENNLDEFDVDDTIEGICSIDTTKWIKSGDWYYYNDVLEPSDTAIKFFEKVTIPTDWTRGNCIIPAVSGKPEKSRQLSLKVTAEAVQLENYETAAAGTPWASVIAAHKAG